MKRFLFVLFLAGCTASGGLDLAKVVKVTDGVCSMIMAVDRVVPIASGGESDAGR